MSGRPSYALQKVIDRTERAATEAGYKVVRSEVLADGTIHVDVVKRRQSSAPRRVYFIQMEQSQHVKIGVANNTRKRLKALQTANPERLVLLGTLYGDESEEAELHRVLAEHRLSGEWFAAGPWLETVRHALKWNRPIGSLLITLKGATP